jgi:hypothetical protein
MTAAEQRGQAHAAHSDGHPVQKQIVEKVEAAAQGVEHLVETVHRAETHAAHYLGAHGKDVLHAAGPVVAGAVEHLSAVAERVNPFINGKHVADKVGEHLQVAGYGPVETAVWGGVGMAAATLGSALIDAPLAATPSGEAVVVYDHDTYGHGPAAEAAAEVTEFAAEHAHPIVEAIEHHGLPGFLGQGH